MLTLIVLVWTMKKYGFLRSNLDNTLFLKQHGKVMTTLIIDLVDMIITRDDSE